MRAAKSGGVEDMTVGRCDIYRCRAGWIAEAMIVLVEDDSLNFFQFPASLHDQFAINSPNEYSRLDIKRYLLPWCCWRRAGNSVQTFGPLFRLSLVNVDK